MTSTNEMRGIVKDLGARSKRLEKIINSTPLCDLGKGGESRSNFESLVSSVISQQLATTAARTIKERFIAEVGKIEPKKILKSNPDNLRACGLSAAKLKTIVGLAEASKSLDFEKLNKRSEEEIYSELTKLWGIGPWTVDMFMMFQLGKLDVWPTGDLGVRRGWEKIYNLKIEITPSELGVKGEKFKPYRSVVAWYCWRALD